MPKLVTDQYPELMHYTTAAGLTGIVSSGCVWATHATFLNDAEEMKHYFDVRLFDLAFEETEKYTLDLANSPEIAKKIDADGGVNAVARAAANELVDHIREATLTFNHPYVFSLSAAVDDRVMMSGLLSQWRGYGSDGGYAIVFDTAGFDRLLKLEGSSFHYQHAQWGDVHYHGIDPSCQPSTEDVFEAEKIVRRGISKVIRGGAVEIEDGLYEAISTLSCLYKHWGFWEEREVRVVAMPFNDEVATLAASEGESVLRRSPKAFLRAGIPVPYLELFANLPDGPHKLPIKRIVVGPHREKTLRAEAVRRLLSANGYEPEVVCSEIPYIGR